MCPTSYVEAVGRVMERANWHTYQVLTKRSSRLRNMLNAGCRFAAGLPNIWWGVSVEDRGSTAWFGSSIDLQATRRLSDSCPSSRCSKTWARFDLEGIHWVIVGGESGAGARPMEKEWVLSIRDQCERAESPVLLQTVGRCSQEVLTVGH